MSTEVPLLFLSAFTKATVFGCLIFNSANNGYVNLSNTHIDHLCTSNDSSLKNLLISVSISNCTISTISTKLFYGFLRLLYLQIENNKHIKTLHSFMFYNISLEALYLANNSIEIIENNAFYTLTNLQRLTLDKNKIKEIVSTYFSNVPKLYELRVNSNKLFRIYSLKFMNGNQSKISLTRNNIQIIDQGAFDEMNITNLNLDNNPLNGSFDWLRTASIKSLRINNISQKFDFCQFKENVDEVNSKREDCSMNIHPIYIVITVCFPIMYLTIRTILKFKEKRETNIIHVES